MGSFSSLLVSVLLLPNVLCISDGLEEKLELLNKRIDQLEEKNTDLELRNSRLEMKLSQMEVLNTKANASSPTSYNIFDCHLTENWSTDGIIRFNGCSGMVTLHDHCSDNHK